MKQFILASLIAVIAMLSGVAVFAQTGDDHTKLEYFAGYSFGRTDTSFGSAGLPAGAYEGKADQHGINGSVVYNLNRYLGIKGDVSGTFKSQRESFIAPTTILGLPASTTPFNSKNSLYNFLGGIQIKDNASKSRIKPFAHALVGVARRSNKVDPPMACITTIVCPSSQSETAFAGAFGGGLDIRINKKVDFRLVQVDYNPISFERGLSNNIRVGVGIVFR